jgi:hypothetical protein
MVAASAAVFGSYVVWLFVRAVHIGRPGTAELALFFLAALAFVIGAAYAWRHSIDGDPRLRN